MKTFNYCQSCGMPISAPHLKGTKADGSPTGEYCIHCYQHGQFVQNLTLDEMIENCLPHLVNSGMKEPQARELLEQTLPTLARWR